MGAENLSLDIKPREFFRDEVCKAAFNQNQNLDQNTEFYLVNLLCDFIEPSKLATLTGDIDAINTPLAMMLKRALEAPDSEKIRIYKYLGDSSLYMSGFFQDFFNRKAFNISYYISLGSSAYNSLSALSRDSQEANSNMYENLSNRFSDLVEIMAEVSDTTNPNRPIDILETYSRWTETKSERLRLSLEKVGITAIPVTRKKQ